MSIINTWVIDQMTCYPEIDGQADVMFIVYWRVNATDGVYNATKNGSVGVVSVAGSQFTPYNQLTQDQVIGWVQDGMGSEVISNIYAALAIDIENQANPPVVNPPLPWAS